MRAASLTSIHPQVGSHREAARTIGAVADLGMDRWCEMTTKACFKCKAVLPLTDFYKHPAMGDGHLGKCKACTKKDAREHRDANLEKIREYDRDRGCRQGPEYRLKYRTENPEKHAARTAVNNAVRDGRLTRQPCEVCGSTDRIHGHHDDYSKPLDVRWLCPKHHHQHHKGRAID